MHKGILVVMKATKIQKLYKIEESIVNEAVVVSNAE